MEENIWGTNEILNQHLFGIKKTYDKPQSGKPTGKRPLGRLRER
jgi:hypothetical protein